jgi:hypothetical protein
MESFVPSLMFLGKALFAVFETTCSFAQTSVLDLIHQATYAFNKIYLRTSIELLHFWAPGCHHQGVIQNKGVQGQHANPGIASPSLE